MSLTGLLQSGLVGATSKEERMNVGAYLETNHDGSISPMRSFGNKESENIGNNPKTFPCLNICPKPSTNKNDAEFIKNLTANPRISIIPSTSRGMDAINIYFKRVIPLLLIEKQKSYAEVHYVLFIRLAERKLNLCKEH
ncbi:unnamed protein product [Acanthoscelides obtectus]|uniref:Uncharacterized protein n=1 Tax=Acanthoscelides obtectus TaxID=200917 RepID=A0A9P0KML9_ACAOB|nr:unnamed protein product [Acanthoscelides obtectus]CAK1641748.1 hypothetical protein AOBTE_LOCUS12607 [Acanthoscelides obtectus]